MKSSPLQKRLLSYKRKIYQKDSVDLNQKIHNKMLSQVLHRCKCLALIFCLLFQINLIAQCPEAAPDCYVNCGVGLLDKDGDGVPDAMDLDTDNDGILDSDECVFTDITSIPNANWNPINGGNVNDFEIGDVFVNTQIFTDVNGVDYDLRFEYLSEFEGGSAFTSAFTNSSFTLTSGEPIENQYFTYQISFVETGSVTMTNLTGTPGALIGGIIIRDIDSGAAGDFTDLGGIINPVSGTVVSEGNNLELKNFNGLPGIYGAIDLGPNLSPDLQLNWLTIAFSSPQT